MGAAEKYRELLRSGRWFRGISEDFQRAVLEQGVLRSLSPDQLLFSRGDPPCGLYAVLSGGVRVTGVTESGKEMLLIVLEPPSWFGEIAVFDDLPRTHDAIADGETLLLQVPHAVLRRALDAHPIWWRDLGMLVTSKLRLSFLALEDAALLPVAVRLARRLVMIAEGYGEWQGKKNRVIEVRQEQLAMMLSTSRQTANQLLKDLEARGVVKLSYGEIELVDVEALKREAKL
jgi:CRP-like cAMP-binding protein